MPDTNIERILFALIQLGPVERDHFVLQGICANVPSLLVNTIASVYGQLTRPMLFLEQAFPWYIQRHVCVTLIQKAYIQVKISVLNRRAGVRESTLFTAIDVARAKLVLNDLLYHCKIIHRHIQTLQLRVNKNLPWLVAHCSKDLPLAEVGRVGSEAPRLRIERPQKNHRIAVTQSGLIVRVTSKFDE